jgi:hypothetical protein
MRMLLSLALNHHQSGYGKNVISTVATTQLFQLRSAAALASDAVARLMAACVENRNTTALGLVGQLPAAAQLDQSCYGQH